jgi:hypothetical protein
MQSQLLFSRSHSFDAIPETSNTENITILSFSCQDVLRLKFAGRPGKMGFLIHGVERISR